MKKHRVTLEPTIHRAALEGRVSLVAIKAKKEPGAVLDLKTGEEVRECVFAQCPYKPGDLLAAMEPFRVNLAGGWLYGDPPPARSLGKVTCRAANHSASRMPLSAVRLWLRVASVRTCRVAEISDTDGQAMGCESCTPGDEARARYALQRGHTADDWCWLLGVERQEAK